jgi:hypothetical protein
VTSAGPAAGPAWPSNGWRGAATRQRPAARPGLSAPPAEPPEGSGAGGGPASGRGQDEPPATPFWLRPIRRGK